MRAPVQQRVVEANADRLQKEAILQATKMLQLVRRVQRLLAMPGRARQKRKEKKRKEIATEEVNASARCGECGIQK